PRICRLALRTAPLALRLSADRSRGVTTDTAIGALDLGVVGSSQQGRFSLTATAQCSWLLGVGTIRLFSGRDRDSRRAVRLGGRAWARRRLRSGRSAASMARPRRRVAVG